MVALVVSRKEPLCVVREVHSGSEYKKQIDRRLIALVNWHQDRIIAYRLHTVRIMRYISDIDFARDQKVVSITVVDRKQRAQELHTLWSFVIIWHEARLHEIKRLIYYSRRRCGQARTVGTDFVPLPRLRTALPYFVLIPNT